MPETVPYNSGLLLADTHSEYTARCMSKRTPSHSIEDLCTANLSMMKRIPEEKSILKIKSRNFDPSMLSSDQAVTGASLEAITALAQARVHNPFPW
jgi:hypothetical protein